MAFCATHLHHFLPFSAQRAHGGAGHAGLTLPFENHCVVSNSTRSLTLQRRNTVDQARGHSLTTSLRTVCFLYTAEALHGDPD